MTAAHFPHGAREALREDGEFILFRSRYPGRAPKATVLLLAPVSARPSRESIQKLEHELSLKVDLDPEWAAVPLALVEHEDRPALLLDDAGGEPLHRLIHGPMELGRFLHFAAGIARALRELHARNLIHKDLKPANVLVDAQTSQVRLMGFGIASRLRRERQAVEPLERIAGTLAYMAPEQTGRMNRSVDSRSDLYALGVTLYEMLTGSLPFNAAEPMEWVHFQGLSPAAAREERVGAGWMARGTAAGAGIERTARRGPGARSQAHHRRARAIDRPAAAGCATPLPARAPALHRRVCARGASARAVPRRSAMARCGHSGSDRRPDDPARRPAPAADRSLPGQRSWALHPLQRKLVAINDGPTGVRVEVHDTGPGLDRARAEELFEAFHTTKTEGLGIGLSISRSIIEAHGGRLWATANVPHGAVFQFSLPIDEASSYRANAGGS